MSTEPRRITIFYSWQSDRPKHTNSVAIRSALEQAIVDLHEKFGHDKLNIVLEEATSREPGSPNIPLTILNKIRHSDILVADITSINSESDAAVKKTPNPNVVFELGFGVAHLGWGNIIMLCNTAFGSIGDVPFDMSQQRVSDYEFDQQPGKMADYRKRLHRLVFESLELIISRSPDRPYLKEAATPDYIKRDRDIKNITDILEHINFVEIRDMKESLPSYITFEAINLWEVFDWSYQDASRRYYDKEFNEKLNTIYNFWKKVVSFGDYYENRGHASILHLGHAGLKPQEIQKIAREIEKAINDLYVAVEDILNYVHNSYLEIDLGHIDILWKNNIREYRSRIAKKD